VAVWKTYACVTIENAGGTGDRCALIYRKCGPRPRETIATIKRTREVSMMDAPMLALVFDLFAPANCYAWERD
jgi:hypothetical protein